MSLSELMIDIPAEHEANVFGQFDVYAKKLERTFHVTLIARDGSTKIVGESAAAEKVLRILTQLVELSKRGNMITEQNVDYAISLVYDDREAGIVEIDKELICHTLQGKPVKPKTLGQKKYVDAIRNEMITFGLGPAGTGKTYLAMAMAITAFKRNEVSRIILTRPAIEAGEIGAPEIRYYVNEKRNAVAPKITDKGADAVQEKINQSFSEEASRAVAEELQDFGAGMAGTLETKSDEILGLLADTRANLAEYQQVLGAFQEDIAEGSARTTHAKETLGGLRPDGRSQKESGKLQHGLCREHKRRGGLAYEYLYRKRAEAEQPGDGSRADA